MWTLQPDKPNGGFAPTLEAISGTYKGFADVDGGGELSTQQSDPYEQHFLASIFKIISYFQLSFFT